MFHFFLFRKKTDPVWPEWKRAVYALTPPVTLFCASVCMGLVLLLFAYGPYSWGAFQGYFRSGRILVMNVLPVVLVTFLFYGVFGRAWSAFLAGGGVSLGFSLGNYFKLQFRDDPLYFEDMLVLREAKAMTVEQHYNLFIDKRMVFALVCLALGTAALCFLARGRLGGWKKRLIVLGAVALVCGAVSPAYLNKKAYDAVENYEYLNRWSATQNYIAHGFAYPFFHSVGDFIETPPAGYHKSEAMELLSAYTDSDIPPDRQINVIAIMREAYADFSRYGVSGLDLSGYDLYHQLEAESLTGNLVTNIFAGGTVDTERCFLTGNYQLKNFRSNANSYLWYLRDQGYTVEGSHPYYQWFYNRQNINCYLGFERYRYYEGDYETRSAAIYPEDAVLLPEIYSDFQKNKATGKPYFSFSVNVQSHGPYATWDTGSPDCFADETYSLACRNAMNYYLATIWETDRELAKLMDWLRDDEEPVVLVTFGDHLPWMGDGNAFYEEMGIDVDPGTEEGFCRHYTTRYLIWANGAARALLGKDLQGQGPDISPCYLMNLVFQQLGWEGPAFMQAMTGMMNMFPVVSSASGLTMVDGRLTADIPEDRRALFQEFLYLQQYWRNEFLYE